MSSRPPLSAGIITGQLTQWAGGRGRHLGRRGVHPEWHLTPNDTGWVEPAPAAAPWPAPDLKCSGLCPLLHFPLAHLPNTHGLFPNAFDGVK